MDSKMESDFSTWFSTYGILTSSTILGTFKIHLREDELLPAIKKTTSVYHKLLAIPVKNVLNGIIYQQAHDYQVYVQKLFVDYLISGEHAKDPESPGASIREQLDEYQKELSQLNESFSAKQDEHEKLILQSQDSLIKCADELQKIMRLTSTKVKEILASEQISKDDSMINSGIRSIVIDFDYINQSSLTENDAIWVNLEKKLQLELREETKSKLAVVLEVLNDPMSDIANILLTFKDQAEEIGLSFRSFRSKFYDLILVVTESINTLPDYSVNLAQEKTNREALYFDAHLGDDLGKG